MEHTEKWKSGTCFVTMCLEGMVNAFRRMPAFFFLTDLIFQGFQVFFKVNEWLSMF